MNQQVLQFAEQGFLEVSGFLSAKELSGLHQEVEAHHHLRTSAGLRNADTILGSVKSIVSSLKVQNVATRYLSSGAKLVRAIIFNKTLENNWLVPWHQDKTIAVERAFEADGWGPWSTKDGKHHVQPPQAFLEQMLTLRLYLDNVNHESGCLRVLPRSHYPGILSQSQVDDFVKPGAAHFCLGSAGSMLIMRPLLLHASSKMTGGDSRLILHLEFASAEIPSP